MHSPWHVPPGKTWVDYELALPPERPIRLKFGIAMGPDVARPGRSDGVTFACYLRADGRERELMRTHHAEACWLDFDFDLAAYAAKTVLVRLQVEPEPRTTHRSLFVLWRRGSRSARRIAAIGDAAAVNNDQAPGRGGGLSRLANRADQGVLPGNLWRIPIAWSRRTWRFIYEDGAAWSTIGCRQPALDGSASALMTPGALRPAYGSGLTTAVRLPERRTDRARGGRARG